MQVSDDPRVGTELAGYRIESLLGFGGMSVVYLAEDLRLKRRVALKLLAAGSPTTVFRDRFLRESELAASIDHPNIVPIYEAGTTEDVLFIAMRYVEGRDLKERLQRGRLEPADAIGILAQVASALDAAHARGLVHRDVKPSNVLLDAGARPDGSDHVYLADFGITKRVSEETAVGDDGHLLGTIDYVAPEQIAGGEVDGRADVYSLGCVLYECLVGQPPFRRDSDLAVVFAHLEAEPPAPSAERPELPPALDAVIAEGAGQGAGAALPELSRARPGGAGGRGGRGDPRARGGRLPRRGRQKRPQRGRGAAGRQGDRPPARARAGTRASRARSPRPGWRPRGSARSRVWRASSRSTPTTSSGASGWSPSWSPASSAPASWPSSARRGVASRRSCAPVCSRPWPEVCCPAARDGGGGCCVRVIGPWKRSPGARVRREGSSRRGTRRAARRHATAACGRPARGAFHRLPLRAERAAFADTLVRAATDPQGRAVVVVALRADFYGRFAAYPALAELLGGNHVLVGPMQASELRRAVELPAGRVGLKVEPELVDALVDDVEGEPGALPLLSTALLELWQKREGDALTLAVYRESGGVHGAVARLAEGTFARVPDERKPLVRALMLRLVGEGEADAPVRRRAPLAELDLERNEDVADVLATLADSRLVTVGEGFVEVAHEALLREWPRLREWIEEDAEGRRLRRHITRAATDWDAAGRDQGELYRGARLAAALDWSTDHAFELNELEREFVTESREASEQETKRARRTNRRLRALLAGVAVLLAAAVVAGGIRRCPARPGARRGDGAARTASRRAGARRGRHRPLAPARPPGRRDRRLAADPRLPARRPAERAEGDAGHARSRRRRRPQRDGSQPGREDARGHRLLQQDPLLRRSDVPADRRADGRGRLDRQRRVQPRREDVRVRRRRLRSPGRRAHTRAAGRDSYRGTGRAHGVHEGRVSARRHDARPVRSTSETRPPWNAWDSSTAGRASSVVVLSTPHFALTPDGRSLVTASDAGELAWWDLSSERKTRTLDDRAGQSCAGARPGWPHRGRGRRPGHPAGRRRAPARPGLPPPASAGSPTWLQFSPDGKTVVSANPDRTVTLWDAGSATPRDTLRGHSQAVQQLVFRSNGKTLYTASVDGNVIAWDLTGSRGLNRPFTFTHDRESDRPTTATRAGSARTAG